VPQLVHIHISQVSKKPYFEKKRALQHPHKKCLYQLF